MADVVQHTAYGYLLDDEGQLSEPLEVTLKSDSNGPEVMMLAGNNAIANGTVVQSLSVKCAVVRGSRERRRLWRAHIRQEYVTFRYRLDDEQYEVRGKINSCTFSSATQKANEFSFDFKGFPRE